MVECIFLFTVVSVKTLMHLRNWQQKFIDEFPSVIKKYRRFIVKAPTGAGKTVLASELIDRFYKGKKDHCSLSQARSS